MKKWFFVFLLIGLNFAGLADNRLIPFQGRITDSENQAISGVYTIVFSIYKAPTGGEAVWSESHQSVSVIQGYVNVLLGTISAIELPDASDDTGTVDFSRPKYIGIKVGSTGQEMLPRHRIVPSFHAQMADKATEAFSARNADKFGNRPPDYYASSAAFNERIEQLQSLIDSMDASYDAMRARLANAEKQTPVGSIVWFTGTNIPENWIKCDGKTLNREGQYAALWEHAKASGNLEDNSVWQNKKKGGFGYGDGTTTFTIPDLRGEFIRAWTDDSTIDTNRQLGSTQTDAGRNVTGQIGNNRDNAYLHKYARDGSFSSGALYTEPLDDDDVDAGANRPGDGTVSLHLDASRVWGAEHTAEEFRPRNVPMIPIIKYQ